MTIAATQTTDFTRPLTREAIQPAPSAKLSVAKDGAEATEESGFSFFGDDGVSFWDVLDVINPLQHIPVVNSIYRDLTGDEIDPAMKLAGGTLFGGVVGLGFAAADVAVDGMTGKDIGEHVIAMAKGDFKGGDSTATYAEAEEVESEALREDVAQAAVPPAPQKRPTAQAEQSAAVAASGAALINASATPNTFSQGLPAWDSLPQSDMAAKPDTVAAVPASAQTEKAGDKVFPVPPRTNMSAINTKSVAELRAETTTASTTGSLSAAPQLSPEAMRAAGLTQDMVDDVLRRHSKSSAEEKVEDQAPANNSQQTASLPMDKPASGLENAWLYSTMTQALDKYQAAQTLNAGPADAVAPASTRMMQ